MYKNRAPALTYQFAGQAWHANAKASATQRPAARPCRTHCRVRECFQEMKRQALFIQSLHIIFKYLPAWEEEVVPYIHSWAACRSGIKKEIAVRNCRKTRPVYGILGYCVSQLAGAICQHHVYLS